MDFNLADLWEAVVDAVPDREALICGDRRLTYAAADERINRLAHALAARGVGAGDHVALYLYNGTEYLEGMLAAYKLGGGADQRELPLLGIRAALPARRQRRQSGDLPPRVRPEAHRDP